MFLEFLYPLAEYFSPFRVFQYLTFRGVYAAITTLLICFIFGGKIIEALKKLKIGQSIRSDGPQSHLKKAGTPTMGGLFIIGSVVISMLLWGNFNNKMMWLALCAFVAFGIIGFIDDFLKVKRHNSEGLPVWGKLAGQFLAAFGIIFYLYFTGDDHTTDLYLPFFKDPVVNLGALWIPFGALLIVAEANGVNFSDGLDGLMAGLMILVFIALAILTYISGHKDYSVYLNIPFIRESGELTILCLAVVGALIAFLWYNAHPAQVFSGDTGSLALGGLVAVISLIIKKEVLVMMVGGIFVLEIASVIIQVLYFKIRKRRVLAMAPLHHHFEMKGWAESKVTVRFWILGGLFALFALSTIKIQ
ncbi:MAG: phospho-N-acetylmuramoyl-pentapeptide-transferase [Treponema sp.]|nr:phospho-N-acetylmuramoyl-pentapeptide-transferase [Treponema sp.]